MPTLGYLRRELMSQHNKGYLYLIREYERSNLSHLPANEDRIIQMVDLIITPEPPLYTASDLNGFVMTLSRSFLNVNSRKDFSENGDNLEFGRLTFIECDVGEESNSYKRVIRLKDEELVKSQECRKITLKGKHNIDLKREINLRIFPDRKIAEIYKGLDSMPLAILEKYRQIDEIEREIKIPDAIERLVYKP